MLCIAFLCNLRGHSYIGGSNAWLFFALSGPRISFKRRRRDSCDIGGSKAWLLLALSGLRRRFQRWRYTIAVTPAGEARRAWLLLALSGLRRRFQEREVR